MNIAVPTVDSTLESAVFCEFAKTPWLLIVDVEKMTCTAIAHSCAAGSDRELARIVLKHRCEALITGKLDEGAFDVLADEGVTRCYLAEGMSAQAALYAMEKRQLELIRNPDGPTPVPAATRDWKVYRAKAGTITESKRHMSRAAAWGGRRR